MASAMRTIGNGAHQLQVVRTLSMQNSAVKARRNLFLQEAMSRCLAVVLSIMHNISAARAFPGTRVQVGAQKMKTLGRPSALGKNLAKVVRNVRTIANHHARRVEIPRASHG